MFQHQYGFTRAANSNPTSSSSFLLHTPHEALFSSVKPSYHFLNRHTYAPASIIKNRHHITTMMNLATTTPLRGDQRPPIDEEDNDVITEIVPLDAKIHPITIIPKYSYNERDLISTTKKRI